MPYIQRKRIRTSQPRTIATIDWSNPLTKTPTGQLVAAFIALPNGQFYDCVGGQYSTLPGNAQHSRDRAPIDGYATVAKSWITGSAGVAHKFPNQTGMDTINGAYSFFVEGSFENATSNPVIAVSADATPHGFAFTFDDTNTITNGMRNQVNGTGTNNTGATSNPLGTGASTKTHRCGLTYDLSTIRYYAKRKQSAGTVSQSLTPGASTTRRTYLLGNSSNSNVSSASLILVWSGIYNTTQFQQLYDNPWQIFQTKPTKTFIGAPLPAGAALTGNVGTTAVGTPIYDLQVALTGNSSTTTTGAVQPVGGGNPGATLTGVSGSTAAGTVIPSTTVATTGNTSTSTLGAAVGSPGAVLLGNTATTDGQVIVSFGPSTGYFPPADGVASASTSAPAANIVGSISGTTLTVSSVTNGTVATGLYVSSSGSLSVLDQTLITAGSGTSWTVNKSQTVASGPLAISQLAFGGTNEPFTTYAVTVPATTVSLRQQGFDITTGNLGAGANGYAQPSYVITPCSVTASITSNVMTVTSVHNGGTVYVGANLICASQYNVPITVTITSLGTGTGGTGTYNISTCPDVPSSLINVGNGQGQYWLSTGKGKVGDAGVFSDATSSSGSSSVVTITRPDGGLFNMLSASLGPIPKDRSIGHCYVKFTGYLGGTGGSVVQTTTVDATHSTVNNSGVITPDPATTLQDFVLTGFTACDTVVMEAAGYANNTIVNGSQSNSPYYMFDYLVLQPVPSVLTPSDTIGGTGNSATSTVGTVTPSGGDAANTVALTGNSATFTPGTVVYSLSLTTTGNSSSTTVGTVVQSESLPITGNVINSTLGSEVYSLSVPITGNSATFTPGTVTPSGGNPPNTVALTGNVSNTTLGALVYSLSKAVTGNASNTTAGTVVQQDTEVLIGNSSSTTAGTVAYSVTIPITGNATTSAVGSIILTFAATGNTGTTALGTTSYSVSVPITGNLISSTAGTVTYSSQVPLLGNLSTSSIGNVSSNNPVTLPITGNSSMTNTGILVASGGDVFVLNIGRTVKIWPDTRLSF
jgi:hypothetical protein